MASLTNRQLLFLGTGTSYGVPVIDCMLQQYEHCPRGVCESAEEDSRHRRGRSSLLLQWGGKNILFDASPDFRDQMLREKISHIDALVMTHKHADHIMGIPDTRSYSRMHPDGLPIYGSKETLDAVRSTFSYIFDPATFVGGGIPTLQLHDVTGPFELFGHTFTPLLVEHGACEACFGYRFGDVAYIPDAKRLPESTKALLSHLDLLIIDCLRPTIPHSTHLILPEVLALVEELQPQRTLATHMTHDMHYKEDKKMVPRTFDFAYDGMVVEF